MLAIVDYGVGNLKSIANMLKKVGYRDSLITDQTEDLERADAIILPGVGHFDYGMQQLQQSGLVTCLNDQAMVVKKPILGICLGAQLITKGSEEGSAPGLGWIDASTIKFKKEQLGDLKIPHMGWTDVTVEKPSRLFESSDTEQRFYFVHSYHMVCHNPTDVLVTSEYGYKFVAGFEKDNIIGMQFHPEKSHKYGMKLFENFLSFCHA